MENDSIISSKNSNKSFGFRERGMRSANKKLKIQVPGLDPMKDMRVAQTCVYPRDTGLRNDCKEIGVPLIISRGQTPEINKIGTGMNIFNFEAARSPNPCVPFGPSPIRRQRKNISEISIII